MILESNPEAKTITMRGMIGDYDNCISADDFLTILAEHADSDVTINLNSEGGSVTDGLSMYNAIKSHAGKVTVHVDALAASIATVICCAADRVVMNPNAKYMIHRCWTAAVGNCRDFRQLAATMDVLDGELAATYAEKTGKEPEILMEMMDNETWLSADDALEMGFIDGIHEHAEKPAAKYDKKVMATLNAALTSRMVAQMDRRLKIRRQA